MHQEPPDSTLNDPGSSGQLEDSARLSRTILYCVGRKLSRIEFLSEISKALMEFSGCDALELRLSDGELHYCWQAVQRPEIANRFELVHWDRSPNGSVIPVFQNGMDLERLCRAVICHNFDSANPRFTNDGSCCIGDAWEPLRFGMSGDGTDSAEELCVGGHYRSLAIICFLVNEQTHGLLLIKSELPNRFTRKDVELYEGAAQTLGLAIAGRRAEHKLHERVKELTCLYGIAQVVEQSEVPLAEMLRRIILLLPSAWQYPEIAAGRITIDDQSFSSPNFRESKHAQVADIDIDGEIRGQVQVVYVEGRPEFEAGVFLKEEENLIVAVAREISLLVERKESENEKVTLQQQLIHADRLATIGQLAAGVAHELNEPLGSILGFAQLAKKNTDVPQQTAADLEKIITAALYAREIIRKLMVFARQVPSRKTEVQLNHVIEEGLYFLESRCTRSNVRVVRELASDLPEIFADPAQLKQILVNLVVNAVQAMPQGGMLTVITRSESSGVLWTVQDTGVGMNEEIQAKIFLPFFTTKGVSEGTGLGLSVVHGIVSSHRGTIRVTSQPGQGTRFEIRLPASKEQELENERNDSGQ